MVLGRPSRDKCLEEFMEPHPGISKQHPDQTAYYQSTVSEWLRCWEYQVAVLVGGNSPFCAARLAPTQSSAIAQVLIRATVNTSKMPTPVEILLEITPYAP